MRRHTHVALDGATFRKSSRSDPDRECVEIGCTTDALGMRDSKQTPSPVLAVDAELGRTFIGAIKTGRFDL